MSGDASKELTGAPIPAPQGDGSDRQRTPFEAARAVIVETARFLAREFSALDRPARVKLFKVFRSELIPRKAPGRKRRKEITAAYEDWKLGIKGPALFRIHIPGFDKLSHWRRREKSRGLMDAIRTRRRRERKQGESESAGSTDLTRR